MDLIMKTDILFIVCYLVPLLVCENGRNVICRSPDIPDFYWREYKGVIPPDALPGGIDKEGRTTYIGQALVYPWGPLPASIYQGNKSAVASAALKTHYVDKNVKILCTQTPERFKWIPTDKEEIQLLTNCNLVLGGVDNGYQENIGRLKYKDQLLLGKVIRKPLNHDGLWVPDNDTEIKFTEYEVLAYDCKSDV